MSLPRFFSTSALAADEPAQLGLSDAEHHHMRVRRIGAGEHVAICCPDGTCWEVEVTVAEDEGFEVLPVRELAAERTANLTLVQGISKGERMDLTVRQACELGVARIIPFMCERSIVRLSGKDIAKKGDRWRRVAESAVKQSGRSIMPRIDDPAKIDRVLDELREYGRVLIPWEETSDQWADDADAPQGAQASSVHGRSIRAALEGATSQDRIAVVIGPEGGFSTHEIEAFEQLSCPVEIVTLGSLILRTETAAVVACALCSFELGGLGNEH